MSIKLTTPPTSIGQYMLSFLAPKDLHANNQTSHSMHTLGEHPNVWKEITRNLSVPIKQEETTKQAIFKKIHDFDILEQTGTMTIALQRVSDCCMDIRYNAHSADF